MKGEEMINILVEAIGSKQSELHIFSRDESGRHTHRAMRDCPCGPAVEHVNIGEGWIIVHTSLDEKES